MHIELEINFFGGNRSSSKERDWLEEYIRLNDVEGKKLLRGGDIIYLHGNEYYRTRGESIEFLAALIRMMQHRLGIREGITMNGLELAREDRDWVMEYARNAEKELELYYESKRYFI
ncbi:hypothetical protein [Candidatus Clostridium radicumherbarum]|uniref:Uncharacterized protein n=1 Tax=Candidatus Clostridium radicumherbarum TaxID=3381662 RepID=A0ABW8TQZ1_9CLOT